MATDRARRRVALAAVAATFVAVHWAVILHRRALAPGDFDVSREFGRRFLAGEPLYAGGLHYPYMPAAAMSFAPLALLPPTLGLALRYALALLSLWAITRLLAVFVRDRCPALAAADAKLAALPLLLASHYLVRDLDDGGPHIILLALAVGGVAALRHNRESLAAAAFGCIAAMKAPYALFLPYFLWKRRWRLALLTAATTAAWVAAPALWMGVGAWGSQQAQWTQTALASLRGAPLAVARESEARVQNQALRPVLERLAASSVASDDSGAAPATDAGTRRGAAAAAPLLLLALCAAWSRHRTAAGDADRLPLEAAAVLLLMALLSPVTWVQHLVVVLPALTLLVADGLAAPRPRRRLAALIPFALLALVLNREILGRAAYVALLSYGLHTWAVLLLLVLLCARAPLAGWVSAKRRAPLGAG